MYDDLLEAGELTETLLYEGADYEGRKSMAEMLEWASSAQGRTQIREEIERLEAACPVPPVFRKFVSANDVVEALRGVLDGWGCGLSDFAINRYRFDFDDD